MLIDEAIRSTEQTRREPDLSLTRVRPMASSALAYGEEPRFRTACCSMTSMTCDPDRCPPWFTSDFLLMEEKVNVMRTAKPAAFRLRLPSFCPSGGLAVSTERRARVGNSEPTKKIHQAAVVYGYWGLGKLVMMMN